jgi:hypothetical protein
VVEHGLGHVLRAAPGRGANSGEHRYTAAATTDVFGAGAGSTRGREVGE